MFLKKNKGREERKKEKKKDAVEGKWKIINVSHVVEIRQEIVRNFHCPPVEMKYLLK